MAIRAAIAAWMMRLPELGSMYAGSGIIRSPPRQRRDLEPPEDNADGEFRLLAGNKDLVGHVLEVVQVVIVGPREAAVWQWLEVGAKVVA
jgi:hypothetical protein